MSWLVKNIGDYRNVKSYAYKLRIKRILPLLDMINLAYNAKGEVHILDVGGTIAYWNLIPEGVLHEKKVRITIVNINSAPLNDPSGIFTSVESDACCMDMFSDLSFDIVHSNSVIEHVGDWDRMVRFSSEIKRLAANYYVQVPYYWFPVEPHFMTLFFHWLPKPWRVFLVCHFNLGYFSKQDSVDAAVRIVECARLLDFRMFTALFPDARIVKEKVFGLTKSLVAIR